MKKLIFLKALLLIAVFSVKGTIINVDNDPNRPSGYYDNLQLAINNAIAGDTIYLYPSNTSYGNITMDKRLHIFGAGYDGTQGNVSRIGNLHLDTATSPSSNPSGSSFQGLTFSRLDCSKPNISNIVVAGNYFFSYVTLSYNCSGWLFTNNYFSTYVNLNNNKSIIFSNNIISNTYGIYYSNSPSVIISHNLFIGWRYFESVYNAIVTDNIFMCASNADAYAYQANNNFINNLSWRSTLNPYNLPPAGNTGTGNVSNQDPQFETAPSDVYFDKSKDYHLKSTSPGKNAASDGTDIGPYGGNNPFVWGGIFSIPNITQTMITNPVINQSTPINVNVKANKAKL
jgi:hypothetical protein